MGPAAPGRARAREALGSRRLLVAGPAGIVLLFGGLTLAGPYRGTELDREVERTHVVDTQLAHLLGRLRDAETGQRGYILSGDARFLEPHHGAREDVLARLATARALMTDSTQRARLAALEPLVEARLARLDDGIRARRVAGLDSAARIVAQGTGKGLMDTLRRRIAEIEAGQARLLAERRARDARLDRLTTWVLGLGTALAMLATLGSSWFLSRDARRQARAQQAIDASAARLDRSREALVASEARAAEERAAADAALHEREARLAGIVGSAMDAIITTDAGQRIVLFNAAAEQLFGWRTEEVLGEPLGLLVPERYRTAHAAHVRAFGATGVTSRSMHAPAQLMARRRDGSEFPIEASISQLETVQGRWFTVILRDVGERLAAEAARDLAFARERAARLEAEEANLARRRFLTTMSHGLRTPLNAIAGHVQLLELGIHGPLADAQRDALARVGRAQRHLLGLITDVLDFARIEAGTVDYDVREVALAWALRDAASMVEPQAETRGIALRVGDVDDAPTVWADAEKLRQVLLNLLANAVKFTAPGGRVDVGVTSDPSRPSQLRVHVRDTGTGIPADKLEAIFEPFVQVETGLTRPHEGTGLGLAISRDLMRGMGGELEVTSVPGEGSTFTLVLRRTRRPDGTPVDRRQRRDRRRGQNADATGASVRDRDVAATGGRA